MPITVNEGGVLYELGTITVNENGVLYGFDIVTTNENGVLVEIFNKGSAEWIWTVQNGASMTVSDDGLTVNITRETNGEGAYTNVISLPACKITASITARHYASGYSGSVVLTCFTADGTQIGNVASVSPNGTTDKTASGNMTLEAGEYYFVFGGGGGNQTGTTGFIGTVTITVTVT